MKGHDDNVDGAAPYYDAYETRWKICHRGVLPLRNRRNLRGNLLIARSILLAELLSGWIIKTGEINYELLRLF